jgi:hypothetical protein
MGIRVIRRFIRRGPKIGGHFLQRTPVLPVASFQ